MYNKILVPLDGSELSEQSLVHVKTIALGCHVPEIILFGVVEPVILPAGELNGFATADWGFRAEKEMLDWLKSYLAHLADKLSKESLNVKTAIAHGKAADEILDYAVKNKVDLIIMTTRGRSGVARWTMGSVSDKVVRYSQAPVLVISPHVSQNK